MIELIDEAALLGAITLELADEAELLGAMTMTLAAEETTADGTATAEETTGLTMLAA